MARSKASVETSIRVLSGIVLFAVAFFIGLSLFSYDWHDVSQLHVPANDPPGNLIGPIGAWLAFGLFMFAGVGAYLVALWFVVLGVILVTDKDARIWRRVAWCTTLFLAILVVMQIRDGTWMGWCARLNLPYTTGLFGAVVTEGLLFRGIGRAGTGILFVTLAVVSLVMLVRTRALLRGYELASGRWDEMKGRIGAFLEKRRSVREESARVGEEERVRLERSRLEAAQLAEQEAARAAAAQGEDEEAPEPKAKAPRKKRKARKPAKPKAPEYADPDIPVPTRGGAYQLPPSSLLDVPVSESGPTGKADIELTSRVLVETLSEFKIDVQVTGVDRGPVVTRYELLPARGVKVERIASLANNLALSLKATSVRVQAPIPGKGVVGIEVPNSSAKLVVIREILESKPWTRSKTHLPLCLGKDVAGKEMVADLSRMPHLLIAGATGTGKSVCMNSMLAGLLMSRTPDELRLMLVDPKIVEFSPYNNLPHLVVPVITDAKKVALGLRWAIREMEKRYKMFSKAGVRNIESYNKRTVAKQEDLFGATDEKPSDLPAKVPYIVIVIDELADLMLVDQAEVENCIARLAQLSRAVGIHMIIATQRPSVNVITGTIKANFPARIAFKVAQRVDSRTILDGMGAETLLGRGDMLFMPPGTSRLARVQGSMITDEEIKRVVTFIKEQVEPSYEMEIKQTLEKSTTSAQLQQGGGEDEVLIEKAIEVIRETRRASTSSLQRRLRIGYTRAARMMDVLEERGLVGPPRGSDPREILIDLDGEIPNNSDDVVETEEDDEEAQE